MHPDDMEKILNCENEFVSGGAIQSDDPWMLETYEENGKEYVSAFFVTPGHMSGMVLHR